MIHYTISDNNLHLIDSYEVYKSDFQKTLNQIRALHPNAAIWNRNETVMKLEWATHNALYWLHIARSHTKDCDLEYPQCFFWSALYSVVGCVVWLFIP